MTTIIPRGQVIPEARSTQNLLAFNYPGWIDNTEKAEVRLADIPYPLRGTGRYFDGITGLNKGNFVVDVHFPFSLKKVVDFVGHKSVLGR